MRAEPKSNDHFLKAFLGFLLFFIITNFDRVALSPIALVHEQDWLDYPSSVFSGCYSLKGAFDFFYFNLTQLGGFDCHAQGLTPYSPISILFSYLSGPWIYFIQLSLCLFISFCGVFFFLRAIGFTLPWFLVSLLAASHTYTVFHTNVAFLLEPAALLIYAWMIRGRQLTNSRFDWCLLFSIIFALVGVLPLMVPFFSLTSLVIPLFVKDRLAGEWKGFLKRYMFFWTLITLLFIIPTLLMIQLTPEMMRAEWNNIGGPKSAFDVLRSTLLNSLKDMYLLVVCSFIALGVWFLNSQKIDKNHLRVTRHSFYFLLFVLFLSRFLAPVVKIWSYTLNPRPLIFLNQWDRFALTLPGLSLVCGIFLLRTVWPAHGFQRPKLTLRKVKLTVPLFLLMALMLWNAHLPASILFVILIGLVSLGLGFWIRTDGSSKFSYPILLLFVGLTIFQERWLFSEKYELRTFASASIPGAKEYALSLPETTRQMFRAVNVGIHPSYGVSAGFQMADGYATVYPLTYKRAWERAFGPSLKGEDGEIIPYFKNWGGRVYAYLPGSVNHYNFTCPNNVLEFSQLANITELRKLAVRWVISRCPLSGDEITQVADNPSVPIQFAFQQERQKLFDLLVPFVNEINQPITTKIYEIKEALPIYQKLMNGHIFIRANVCHLLKTYGYKNSDSEFGFEFDPSDKAAYADALHCYPNLKDI